MRGGFIYLLTFLTLTASAQSGKIFSVIDATYQLGKGGHPNSGMSENYVVLLRIETNQKFSITRFWVNGSEVYFELQNYRMLLDRAPGKGDTVAVVYHNRKSDSQTNTNLKEGGSSSPCKSKAVVEYSVGDKIRILKVKHFRKLQTIAAP